MWMYTKKVDKSDIIKNTKNKTSKEQKNVRKKSEIYTGIQANDR